MHKLQHTDQGRFFLPKQVFEFKIVVIYLKLNYLLDNYVVWEGEIKTWSSQALYAVIQLFKLGV